MKTLQQHIEEKLYHQQVDEKLIINKELKHSSYSIKNLMNCSWTLKRKGMDCDEWFTDIDAFNILRYYIEDNGTEIEDFNSLKRFLFSHHTNSIIGAFNDMEQYGMKRDGKEATIFHMTNSQQKLYEGFSIFFDDYENIYISHHYKSVTSNYIYPIHPDSEFNKYGNPRFFEMTVEHYKEIAKIYNDIMHK